MKIIKRFFILGFSFFFLCLPTFAVGIDGEKETEGIAQNKNIQIDKCGNTEKEGKVGNRLKISIDEFTANITITDTVTNAVWTSNPIEPQEDDYTPRQELNNLKSQLIVSYYDEKNKNAVIGSYLSSVKRGTFEIKEIENGFRVNYSFSRKNEGFEIPVEYTVSDNVFRAAIILKDIKEKSKMKISEISLLPFFMRGIKEENGFIFVPDGCGAVIDFKSVKMAEKPYKQRIYGHDYATSLYHKEGNEAYATMPVFGISRGENSMLAIVDGNESAAHVCAECVGISTSYARVYASFIYRDFDTVKVWGSDWQNKTYITASEHPEKSNFSVSYHFLTENGYIGMANEYREYLIEKNNLEKLNKDNFKTGALYFYGCVRQKNSFLGVPNNKTISATNFKNLYNILEELHKIENLSLSVYLKNFDKDTYSNNYPSSTKWVGKTGGESEYKKIYKRFSDKDDFYQIKDFIYKKTSVLWLEQFKFAQMVSKDCLPKNKYSVVSYEAEPTGAYGLNIDYIKKYTERFIKRNKNKNNIGIAVENMGDQLYADFNTEKNVSRQSMSNFYRKTLEKFSINKIKISVKGGNIYLLGITDTVYDIPDYSSDFSVTTKSIPFYQIVLHGYINMVSSNLNLSQLPKESYLNCIESGMIPCFGITHADATHLRRTNYKDLFNTCWTNESKDIKDRFERSSKIINKIYNSKIIDHSVKNGVAVTVYENRIKTVVNYNKEAVEFAGHKINPQDFVLIEN